MKLGFSPSIGPFDFETDIDCTVEWSKGQAKLTIDGVFILGSEDFNLLTSEDSLFVEIGGRIADLAERDERLLARAAEQAMDEAA